MLNGWFAEVNRQWPGVCHGLEVEEVLFDDKSIYQHCVVFKSKTFGNVMVLDGCIQLTERDELSYHEMMTHLPMFANPNPQSVLIVGGGDGANLREVLKHGCVKEVVICEIDEMVISCSKKFFSKCAPAWNDPRVKVIVDDAAKFLDDETNHGRFDVILCDSSDPDGPAGVLFEQPFYKAMHAALKPGGKISTQAENYWTHLHLIKRLIRSANGLFANVEYAYTQLPFMPLGIQGFLMCSKAGPKAHETCSKAVRQIDKIDKPKFRYYSEALHAAAFVLPVFVSEAVEQAKQELEQQQALLGIVDEHLLQQQAIQADDDDQDTTSSSSSSSDDEANVSNTFDKIDCNHHTYKKRKTQF